MATNNNTTRRRRGGGGGGGRGGGVNSGGMEENTMAILDNSCFTTPSQHLSDDRFTYLEAVRSNSIVPENGSAPTQMMLAFVRAYDTYSGEARISLKRGQDYSRGKIHVILKDECSLDLIMASYLLLKELDKRFPRVSFSRTEKSESSSPPTSLDELVVVEEAWSPFSFNQDKDEKGDGVDPTTGSLYASGFHLLIQNLGEGVRKTTPETLELKLLRNMLLLQYLVSVLEADFSPRNVAFKENKNWILLRESLLNMILGSRKIIYKGLIKDCLSVMSEMSNFPSESPLKVSEKCDSALTIALPEIVDCTRVAFQKLVLMIMELDSSKKSADTQCLTNRADGIRTPAVEIILEELMYNKDILSPFFEVFHEPKWKLDIVVQYLRKYIPKASVRTRRSNGSTDDATFGGILKSFSNSNSAKSIIKKLGPEVAQLLLAHAFQAFLSLPAEGISDATESVNGSSLEEICKSLISAFTCLKRTDESTEILPFGKEALFTAATVLSRSS